ncbi:MAG: hypothetical protein RR214_03945 [Synergistaceae bacterium]
MRKKIKRLQRWLDRLSSACESRCWDSALIEADCLSAEIHDFREELWTMLQDSASSGGCVFYKSRLAMSFRSVCIALLIVMFSTIPIALESDKPIVPVAKGSFSDTETLNWVTGEEMELLRTLRAELSSKNSQSGFSASAPTVRVAKKVVEKPKVTNTVQQKTERNVPSNATIAPEYLLSLIQVGEKALRTDAPAIKVLK